MTTEIEPTVEDNYAGTDLQDRVVFSLSMAMARDYKALDAERAQRGPAEVPFESMRRMLDRLEVNKPIIFGASGNFR